MFLSQSLNEAGVLPCFSTGLKKFGIICSFLLVSLHHWDEKCLWCMQRQKSSGWFYFFASKGFSVWCCHKEFWSVQFLSHPQSLFYCPASVTKHSTPVPSFLATCLQGLGLFVPLGCFTDGFSGWFELVWVVTHFFCRHNCFPSCRLKPFLCLILSMSLNGP